MSAFFLLVTIGYPIAVDQGWLHYNPYVLPVIIFGVASLYAVLLFDGPWFRSKAQWVIFNTSIFQAFLSFAILFGGTAYVLLRGYFIAFKFSNQHVSAMLNKTETQQDPFSVEVEYKIASPGGEDVTPFWVRYLSNGGCAISPAQAVLFVRVTNLKPVPTLITGYTVDAWKTLIRLPMRRGQPFLIPKLGSNYSIGTFDFPSPQNLGSLMHVRIQDEDYQHAMPLEMNLLDRLLGDRPLTPNEVIRGWAFFEYSREAEVPFDLKLRITDESGKTFSYSSPGINGNPNADTLSRAITKKQPIDLSSCVRGFYYLKEQAH